MITLFFYRPLCMNTLTRLCIKLRQTDPLWRFFCNNIANTKNKSHFCSVDAKTFTKKSFV